MDLSGTLGVIVVAGAAALMADRGLRLWKSGQLRIGIAYLLAFCLLLPIALLVAFGAYHLFTRAAANPDWELLGRISKTFKQTTNAQIWWAVILSLPAYVWLRRFTKSSENTDEFVNRLSHSYAGRGGLTKKPPNRKTPPPTDRWVRGR